MNCFYSCHSLISIAIQIPIPIPISIPIPVPNAIKMSLSRMQIHLPATGLASFGRGVARRIRVNVKPPNDDVERDLKRNRNISIKTDFHTFPTMQDPEHAVGEEHISNFADTTSPTAAPAPYETSAPLTAATAPPAASGIDATKKAVDNVLYSDVRTEFPMRQPHANHWP
jgi:hypothetical protein